MMPMHVWEFKEHDYETPYIYPEGAEQLREPTSRFGKWFLGHSPEWVGGMAAFLYCCGAFALCGTLAGICWLFEHRHAFVSGFIHGLLGIRGIR